MGKNGSSSVVGTAEGQLLGALLAAGGDDEFLEIRAISSARIVRQWFHKVVALRNSGWRPPDIERMDGMSDVYYGVVPRVARLGKADACGPALTVWTDFDEGAPTALPLPPSVVVETSPGKYQALWLLDHPCDDLDRIEALNRAIACHHGGDRNACDRARVLRFPGFANLKYADHPRAKLVVLVPDRRFAIKDLEEAFPVAVSTLPSTLPRRVHHHDAPKWLSLVFDALLDFLAAGGFSPRPTGNAGVLASCPMHDDRHPSLSLHPVRGWRCWAGCGQGRLTALASRLGVSVWRIG